VLVLDMIEILPSLGKYKYDTCRILPVKCYIDNSVCLRSCIRNVNSGIIHLWGLAADRRTFCRRIGVDVLGHSAQGFTGHKVINDEKYSWRAYLFDRWIGILCRGPDGGVKVGTLGIGSFILILPLHIPAAFLVFSKESGWWLLSICHPESLRH
jgi:hypothetical protein